MNQTSIFSYYQEKMDETYYLTYYISNYSYTKSIYNNASFKINSTIVKNYCTDENQPCLIRFLAKPKYKKDSTIELKVNTIEKFENKTSNPSKSLPNPKSNFLKDNLKLILIISGSALIFIIIIIIIICACKKKSNKDLLALQVNKVSFEEEKANRYKAYDNGLLY